MNRGTLNLWSNLSSICISYKSTILGVSPEGDKFHVRFEDNGSEEEGVLRKRIKPYVSPQNGEEVHVYVEDGYVEATVVNINEDGTYTVDFEDLGQTGIVSDDILRRKQWKFKQKAWRRPQETLFTLSLDTGIKNYLNPKFFENPETMLDIGRRLRKGHLVVIRNAFIPEFADACTQIFSKIAYGS